MAGQASECAINHNRRAAPLSEFAGIMHSVMVVAKRLRAATPIDLQR